MGQRQRGYAEIEAGAVEIREYTQLAVPGLLQTQEYARLRALGGKDLCEGLDLDSEATGRQVRQVHPRPEQPPRYEAVVDERCLRSGAGPEELMRSQSARPLELAERPKVTIRVLPLSARVAD
jgi:hypothetical protein